MQASSPFRGFVYRSSFLGLVLLVAATVPCAARASIDATPQVVVGLDGLDWSSPLTAQHVYVRVRHAAERVCNRYIGPLSTIRTRSSPCYADAVRTAVALIDDPRVSELAAGRDVR